MKIVVVLIIPETYQFKKKEFAENMTSDTKSIVDEYKAHSIFYAIYMLKCVYVCQHPSVSCIFSCMFFVFFV